MSAKAETVKELPQPTTPASSKTPKASIKNFSVNELGSLNKAIDWPGREKSPSPLLLRKASPALISGSVRGQKISDGKFQQGSEAISESASRSYSKFDTEEHGYKNSSEGSSLQLRHKATITRFPFDLPFDFQLKIPSSKEDLGEDEDEAEQVSPSIYSDRRSLCTDSYCESGMEHGYQDSNQNDYQLQPQRFSPTPSFANNDHNLHECPFYTNEVSNLKLQVIELEYINATLENKVRKYRDEIRLFKQDIKGYKFDGRQFAELLVEKENEIETLHRKIAQLLDQDTLPSPPRPTQSPMNGGSYKRFGHIAGLSVKRRGFGHNKGAQRSSDLGSEQTGRAETENMPQWWM